MWEAISNVLNGANGVLAIIVMFLIILLIVILGKHGLIHIHTKNFKFGIEERERTVLREQCDYAHTFIRGLSSKVIAENVELKYGGYFAKYVLELVYDEVVRWITFNHINTSEAYVHSKQSKIASLVYGMGVLPEFKTPEFKKRIDRWTEELINELVRLRQIYSEEKQCGN